MSIDPPATRRRAGLLLIALALLAGVGAAGAWLAHRGGQERPGPPPPADDNPDPRLTYAGPYRNIAPNVGYVGDAECARCHRDIAESYAHHPMGQSLAPAAELAGRQSYGPDVHNPFSALGRRFEVVREGDRVQHRQTLLDAAGRPVVELSHEVLWAVGSGKKGYSYLTERDGYLLQTPISWFAQQRRWDLSPGFGPTQLAGRVVSASCLSCHANRLREDPERPDHFEAPVFQGMAIGCERCHGPGELHARGEGDYTIVNPAHLSPPLRDAVCEQCHLEGEGRVLRRGRGVFDYRPGLNPADFWAVLVMGREGDEKSRAVSHVEQMYQSQCFRRPIDGQKLGCITCHDPHAVVAPDQREAHYRAACLKCHDEGRGQAGCSVAPAVRRQTSPGDSCIDCHMTRYAASDIPHTASTDHSIPRRPAARPAASSPPDFESARLVNFYQDRYPAGDPQAERSLGLGLLKMMHAGLLRPERHGERTLRLLESALGDQPGDATLHEGKAAVLLLMGRRGEALAEARLALAKQPRNWRLLADAAGAAQAEGQPDLALDYWRQAVESNPTVPDYQVSLVAALVRAGLVDEARTRCQALLRLDPFNVQGRQAWVGFLLADGKKEEARSEFEIIRRLAPPDLAQREEWFRRQLR